MRRAMIVIGNGGFDLLCLRGKSAFLCRCFKLLAIRARWNYCTAVILESFQKCGGSPLPRSWLSQQSCGTTLRRILCSFPWRPKSSRNWIAGWSIFPVILRNSPPGKQSRGGFLARIMIDLILLLQADLGRYQVQPSRIIVASVMDLRQNPRRIRKKLFDLEGG
jgi:hypothetical protein